MNRQNNKLDLPRRKALDDPIFDAPGLMRDERIRIKAALLEHGRAGPVEWQHPTELVKQRLDKAASR